MTCLVLRRCHCLEPGEGEGGDLVPDQLGAGRPAGQGRGVGSRLTNKQNNKSVITQLLLRILALVCLKVVGGMYFSFPY